MHRHTTTLELQTEVREDFTITEKAPTRGAFNQEKALVWAFPVIVKTDGLFVALDKTGTGEG